MSPRQRRNHTGSQGNAGGGRVAMVLAFIVVGTVLGGIFAVMAADAPEHVHDDSADDVRAMLNSAIVEHTEMSDTLARRLSRVTPEALRNRGAL